MSKIRSKDTKIELLLRKALTKNGHRYRKHYKGVPGSPDIAFVSRKLAIFCDSSFWHGRDWQKLKKRLKSNRQFWIDKIKGNIARDHRIEKELNSLNWKVLRFWEEDINERIDWCVGKVEEALASRRRDMK